MNKKHREMPFHTLASMLLVILTVSNNFRIFKDFEIFSRYSVSRCFVTLFSNAQSQTKALPITRSIQ